MAEMCTADDGATSCPSSPSSSILTHAKGLTHSVIPLLYAAPLLALFVLPLLWRALGSALGWYLRKKTEGRRCLILELVAAESDLHRQSRRNSAGSIKVDVDAGWDATPDPNTTRDKSLDDWDGIVGFFHPFW